MVFFTVVFKTDIGEERLMKVFKKSFYNFFFVRNHLKCERISTEYQVDWLKRLIFGEDPSSTEDMISCNLLILSFNFYSCKVLLDIL